MTIEPYDSNDKNLLTIIVKDWLKSRFNNPRIRHFGWSEPSNIFSYDTILINEIGMMDVYVDRIEVFKYKEDSFTIAFVVFATDPEFFNKLEDHINSFKAYWKHD